MKGEKWVYESIDSVVSDHPLIVRIKNRESKPMAPCKIFPPARREGKLRAAVVR